MNFAATFAETDNRSRLFWRLQALGWGGTLPLTFGVGGLMYSTLGGGICLGFFRGAFGFAATSIVLRPVLRLIRRRGQVCTAPNMVIIAIACGLLGAADTLFLMGIASSLQMNLDQPGVRPFLMVSVGIRCVLYGFWSILYFAVHYWLDTQRNQLRVAQTEAAARSSELQVLRSQVNPHFLFNALNSILAASGDPRSVRRVTLALSDYLRFSLNQHGETERLGIELDALENYLRVEKIRFEKDLEYRIESDDLALQSQAPVALVQPLLENAIKYGQYSLIRPLRILISARVADHMLSVTVANTGDWLVSDSPTKTGLSNLRRRLKLLYGSKAGLAIETANGEVRVRVLLPASLHENKS